jgi:hypothetical protein
MEGHSGAPEAGAQFCPGQRLRAEFALNLYKTTERDYIKRVNHSGDYRWIAWRKRLFSPPNNSPGTLVHTARKGADQSLNAEKPRRKTKPEFLYANTIAAGSKKMTPFMRENQDTENR